MQQNVTKKHLIIALATLVISAGFMSTEAAAQAGATTQSITSTGAVGVSTLIAGAVCVPVGKSRMNDIVERCNASNNGYTVTMNFGPCPHGIGMTLNF